MPGSALPHHPAQARQEPTEQNAWRLLAEELDKLDWSATELAAGAKGDVRKLRMGRRLRAEMAVMLKGIAMELDMETCAHASNLLANMKAMDRSRQTELNSCQW